MKRTLYSSALVLAVSLVGSSWATADPGVLLADFEGDDYGGWHAEGEAFGDALVLRGARERLTPVLMTALTAALALVPLLFAAEAPGKEILHPVAVVIFGGLVSSTLLDVLLTPLLFRRYGGPALASIDSDSSQGDTP